MIWGVGWWGAVVGVGGCKIGSKVSWCHNIMPPRKHWWLRYLWWMVCVDQRGATIQCQSVDNPMPIVHAILIQQIQLVVGMRWSANNQRMDATCSNELWHNKNALPQRMTAYRCAINEISSQLFPWHWTGHMLIESWCWNAKQLELLDRLCKSESAGDKFNHLCFRQMWK